MLLTSYRFLKNDLINKIHIDITVIQFLKYQKDLNDLNESCKYDSSDLRHVKDNYIHAIYYIFSRKSNILSQETMVES